MFRGEALDSVEGTPEAQLVGISEAGFSSIGSANREGVPDLFRYQDGHLQMGVVADWAKGRRIRQVSLRSPEPGRLIRLATMRCTTP